MSWSAPGTVAQPAPTLAFSAQPIAAHNPGRLVKMPDPKPSANQVPGAAISLLLGGPVAPLVSATVFGSPATV